LYNNTDKYARTPRTYIRSNSEYISETDAPCSAAVADGTKNVKSVTSRTPISVTSPLASEDLLFWGDIDYAVEGSL
jgi:hypothetical protein